MTSLEGQTLGPYRILERLGQGGMATVYKAYHPRLDRNVAIKMLHQAFMQDQSFLTRFEREAQIVARLEHPHIVPVYDFADYNGQPYLVMKFIEGQTLKAVLTRNALKLDDILRLMPPVADALDYAHRMGVLHRDIKPSNIIIDTNGTPYLTDFGLARMAQLGESTLSADILLGTPHYISPEQAMGRKDLDSRTDLYSLGVVLYELVVGQVPFSADTPFAVIHDHIYRALPSPSAVNPDVSPLVESVLQKSLAKDPPARYESARAMIEAFRAAVAASGMTTLNPERRSIASDSIARLRSEQDGAGTVVLDTPPPQSQPMKPVAAVSAPPTPPAPPAIPAPVPPAPPQPATSRRVEASFDFSNLGSVLENAGEAIEEAIEGAFGKGTDVEAPDDETALRRRIEKQMKQRNEFVGHAVAYFFVNLFIWGMFLFGSGFLSENIGDWAAFPWPIFVTFGWGAGLVAHAVETHFGTGARAARRVRIIHSAYESELGANWQTADKNELRRIRRRADKPFKERVEFFEHLGVYAMINVMLWVMYLFGTDAIVNLIDPGEEVTSAMEFPWPLGVMLLWGIGLVINGIEAFGSGRHQNALEREVARERERLYGEKAKRALGGDESSYLPERGVRLTEDGEFTDSMIEEIERDSKRKRG